MRFNPFMCLVRSMLWMVGIGLVTLLLASNMTARFDTALYDLNQRYWHYTPDSNVVIVAIDPKSLAELGRWPWPRSIHAHLLDHLTAAGVRGIGMDVTMSAAETDHPENDQMLVQAIRHSGKVVMPMFAEATDLGGPLGETLPLPMVAQSVAGIGHVDVAKDADGLARGAYLTSGLGQPYWPSLALALYELEHPLHPEQLPGLRDPATDDASPYLWMRDHYVMLRYAGPAGSFGRVSYADVIDGSVPAALLKGHWVLVGATAEGMEDILQTPEGLMPGVEYQANVLESLQNGSLVTPLSFLGQFMLGGAVLMLPLLVYGLPGLHRMWRAALASAVFVLALSLCLLRVFYLWWPPVGCLLIMGFGFGGWSLFALRQRQASN